MLLALTHSWPLRQRMLIAVAVFVGLATLGVLVYRFERYHRGPTESVFYGTWQDTRPAMDTVNYLRFTPDHTALLIGDGLGELSVRAKGKWYAGGEKIYFWMRFRYSEEQPSLVVWRIEDIKPNEITVRRGNDAPMRFIRVTLDVSEAVPEAFNQTLQRTAGRPSAYIT